jgi:hypothetical protein
MKTVLRSLVGLAVALMVSTAIAGPAAADPLAAADAVQAKASALSGGLEARADVLRGSADALRGSLGS